MPSPTCEVSGKSQLTRSAAVKLARRVNRLGGAGHVEAYRAHCCSWWHIGHVPFRVHADREAARRRRRALRYQPRAS